MEAEIFCTCFPLDILHTIDVFFSNIFTCSYFRVNYNGRFFELKSQCNTRRTAQTQRILKIETFVKLSKALLYQ